MKQFYNLKVGNISIETELAKAITFEIPVSLQQHFGFQAGQYITLRHKDSTGIVHNRCYSISSIPADNHITIGVKKVKGGKVSPFLVETLKEGDLIEVASPEGNFKLSPTIFRSISFNYQINLK